MPKIEIKCKGSKYVPIEQLQNFQGNLKELKRAEFNQIKKSLLKYGFTFPVFVWGYYLLDGHQRIFVLKQLLNEGYTVDNIPVVEIEAEDRKEAAEKLLMVNSKFAKMTEEGLYEFVYEYTVDISDLSKELNLPDIDMEKFLNGWGNDDPDSGVSDNPPEDNYGEQHGVIVLCESESKQEEIYNSLVDQGYNCKVVST